MSEKFVKVYVTSARDAARKLGDEEWNALTKMVLYIQTNDNTVRSPEGRWPATQEDVAMILGKSLRHTQRVLNSLERCGAIMVTRRGKFKVYTITSLFARRGTSLGYPL